MVARIIFGDNQIQSLIMKKSIEITLLFLLMIAGLAAPAQQAEKPLSVGIFIYPGVEILDFGGPSEVFGSTQGFKPFLVAYKKEPMVSQRFITVTPQYSIEDCPPTDVLVFPGGSREVNKRRGEKYRLMWKERIGFAKIAIEHGYPIIPFAAVGAEEMFDVLLDEHNLLYARFSSLVQRITGWPIHTIVKGMGPTLIPRPERLYFWFGKPIQTSDLEGKASTSNAKAIRDHVKAEIETGIDTLLRIRESDPHRHISTRILSDAR